MNRKRAVRFLVKRGYVEKQGEYHKWNIAIKLTDNFHFMLDGLTDVNVKAVKHVGNYMFSHITPKGEKKFVHLLVELNYRIFPSYEELANVLAEFETRYMQRWSYL